MLYNSTIDKLIEMSLLPMAAAIMDRISYYSYKVNVYSDRTEPSARRFRTTLSLK